MGTTLTIDMDKKCAECKKKGATPCGLCLNCILKCYDTKPLKSDIGKKMQMKLNEYFKNKDLK